MIWQIISGLANQQKYQTQRLLMQFICENKINFWLPNNSGRENEIILPKIGEDMNMLPLHHHERVS